MHETRDKWRISAAPDKTFDLQRLPTGMTRTRAHLIAHAGSGMRSLAAVLAQAGWQLSGSDAAGGSPADSPALFISPLVTMRPTSMRGSTW